MFENNTDRMFWTIAVLILSATLLMISNKAFPKAQESIMTTISQNVKTGNSASDQLSKNAKDSVDDSLHKPSYPIKNNNFKIEINEQNQTGNIVGYSGPGGHVDIPAWQWSEKLQTNVKVTAINGTESILNPNGVFQNKGLTSVTIPNTITYIGNSSFVQNKISNLTIPKSVTQIDSYVFCFNDLKHVNFEGKVQRLGANTYNNPFALNNNLDQETKNYLDTHYEKSCYTIARAVYYHE